MTHPPNVVRHVRKPDQRVRPLLPIGDTQPTRVGPAKLCPSCRSVLDGGPVRFRCGLCRRAVMAADIDNEYRPPAIGDPSREMRAAA